MQFSKFRKTAEKAGWIKKISGLQSFKANKRILGKIFFQKSFLTKIRKNEKSLFLKIQGFFLAVNTATFGGRAKIQYFFVRKTSKNVKKGPLTTKKFLAIKWVKKRSGKKRRLFYPEMADLGPKK